MTQEQLNERIQKTLAKIEKIEKRISKWQKAMTKEACLKHYDYMLSWGKSEQEILDRCYDEYIKNCNWELDHAVQDLHDTQLTLEKYQNMLNLEIAKDNEFENNRIMVIWEFLLNYKEQVAQYIRDNMEVLNEYYKVSSEACDWHNHKYSILQEKDISEEDWKEHYKELNHKERELKEAVHPITSLVAKYNGYRQPHTVDEAKLEEILLKDCKARYFQLVKEVTEITGIIIDATNLSMHGGELNGIIIGEKGKAKVQTFSAGGHSTHIIVNEKHGQCFHYRTRVDRVD